MVERVGRCNCDLRNTNPGTTNGRQFMAV